MKKLVLANLVLFLFAPWFALAVEAEGLERGLLWRVEDDQGHTSFLFGTIHSEDARVLDFPPALQDALSASQIFAMELVPDIPTLTRLTEMMNYQDGTTLAAVIGRDLYERVAVVLDGYGVPRSMLETMKPWAAAMTLSVPPPETGLFLDLSLSLRAAGMGLKVKALETLEEQVGFLEGLTLEAQLDMLQTAVEEQADLPRQIEEMIAIYLEHDLNKLADVANRQLLESNPDMAEYFQREGIDKRNKNMFSRLQPMLTEGGVFVAVGALHLTGEQGLIGLARGAGYRVSPVY